MLGRIISITSDWWPRTDLGHDRRENESDGRFSATAHRRTMCADPSTGHQPVALAVLAPSSRLRLSAPSPGRPVVGASSSAVTFTVTNTNTSGTRPGRGETYQLRGLLSPHGRLHERRPQTVRCTCTVSFGGKSWVVQDVRATTGARDGKTRPRLVSVDRLG